MMINSDITPPAIVCFQPPLCPALPIVLGNIDYTNFAATLDHIDHILRTSKAEQLFVNLSLARFDEECRLEGRQASPRARSHHFEQSISALRCTVLGQIIGGSVREQACRLAESPLCRQFCRIDALERVRVPSKTQLNDFTRWLPEDQMRLVIDRVILAAAMPGEMGALALGLEREIELDTIWSDGTCMKANIHFPADWVLMRDGVRTLMKGTKLIREHGLKVRMEEPEVFLKRINQMAISMSQASRRKEGKKQRKGILREMKKLTKAVGGHARRHRDALDERWEETDWTRKEAEVVIRRMDNIIEQLPEAMRQAHERIIGERQVESKEKILSLYEKEVNVVIRGKAGAQVEFGNPLWISEQKDGIIVDHRLYEDNVSEAHLFVESLGRIKEKVGQGVVKGAVADCASSNRETEAWLAENGIKNYVCPKNPKKRGEAMKDKDFAEKQKRRGQTEGRIGILKNDFLGSPMRGKGIEQRKRMVNWAVLTHNLWVLARKAAAVAKEREKAAAA